MRLVSPMQLDFGRDKARNTPQPCRNGTGKRQFRAVSSVALVGEFELAEKSNGNVCDEREIRKLHGNKQLQLRERPIWLSGKPYRVKKMRKSL